MRSVQHHRLRVLFHTSAGAARVSGHGGVSAAGLCHVEPRIADLPAGCDDQRARWTARPAARFLMRRDGRFDNQAEQIHQFAGSLVVACVTSRDDEADGTFATGIETAIDQ